MRIQVTGSFATCKVQSTTIFSLRRSKYILRIPVVSTVRTKGTLGQDVCHKREDTQTPTIELGAFYRPVMPTDCSNALETN